MRKLLRKKIIIFIGIIFIGAIIGFKVLLSSNGWTFIKVDGEIYVLNSIKSTIREGHIGEELGSVKKKIFSFLKPIGDYSSNGFPYGTPIYKDLNSNGVIVSHGDNYFRLDSIKKIKNWNSGIKYKVKDNNVVIQ